MNVIPFQFESSSIRVVTGENGEQWFVGKDICEALGYVDPKSAMRSHCKGVQKLHPLQTTGGIQPVRLLSEPDVLRLIVSSNLPAAQRFEAWVFEEVLPSIRKTGSYKMGSTLPTTPNNITPAEYAVVVIESVFKVANLFGSPLHLAQTESVKMARKLSGVDMSPLLLGSPAQNNIPDHDVWLEPTELGRRLGVSRAKINPLLEQAGLQSKVRGEWVATEKGEKISSRHHWSVGPKSGYNLKWKFRAVEEVLKSLVSPNPAPKLSS